MRSKGTIEDFANVLLLIFSLGMLLFIWFTFQGNYWLVTSDFEKLQTVRMAANLGYVISGSTDALAFSDGTFTYSRILDSNKLDKISSIPSKYYYPGYSYEISVKDLETGKWWVVRYGTIPIQTSHLPSSAQGTIPATVQVSIPVNIVYPTASASAFETSNDVNVGVMKIEMSKASV